MSRERASLLLVSTVSAIVAGACALAARTDAVERPYFEIVCPPEVAPEDFSGRAIVFLSKTEPEPRLVMNPARLEPVVAADFRGIRAGAPMRIGASNALAFPAPPGELEGGTYWAQAVLDVDPDAPWPGLAPGNPCSQPVRVELGGGRSPTVRLVCDGRIPSRRPDATRYVRVVDLESERLTAFRGRPVRLRALVHLPEAWFAEPDRRFPMLLYVSGFGASLESFESVDWPAAPIDGESFVIVYPDPSCASGHSAFLDSETNGPWGSALVQELLPELARRFRLVEHREGRLLAGHSSGGWTALSLIVRHPALFGAAWASSPDPVDFRDFMGVDLYEEDADFLHDPSGRPRPFCKLGGWTVNTTLEHAQREQVLRGGVLRFFEALWSGPGDDGAPQPLFDRATGAVDPAVVDAWREHDLSRVLRERWDELGPLLDGRLVLTIGDRDNFLLQGSALLLQRELEALDADVDVHLLSGDHFTELDGPRSVSQSRRWVDHFRTWRRQTAPRR